MTSGTGRGGRDVKIFPDQIRAPLGLNAFVGKASIPAGSTSVFVSCTAINSAYLIDSLAIEFGSTGSFVGSIMAMVGVQVWPGSGVNFAYLNGVTAAIPATVHYRFTDLG